MAIEGPLKELHIHDVFQLLDLGRKTGVLRVTSELRQNAGTVYLVDGAVVGAVIQSNPHPLGGLLVKAGKLTPEDLATARELQKRRNGMKLGEVLVEMGVVTRKELERQIRAQVEEVIFELMSWAEGYFSFVEEAPEGFTAEANIRIPTESLLMEAARRIDEWSRFESKIPHLGVVPRLNTGGDTPTLIDLRPEEWAVLAAVDGTQDVRTVAEGLARSDFEIAKTLFGLASAGIIVLEDPKAAPANRASELAVLVARTEDLLTVADVPAAQLTAEEAVASYPQEGVAHLVLGRARLAANRFGEAARAFEESVSLEPTSAPAHRLLGHAYVGLGRFREAIDAWQRWRDLPGREPYEKTHAAQVDACMAAAAVLDDALGGPT